MKFIQNYSPISKAYILNETFSKNYEKISQFAILNIFNDFMINPTDSNSKLEKVSSNLFHPIFNRIKLK